MESYRRHLVGILALILMAGWALTSTGYFSSSDPEGISGGRDAMIASGLGRVGLVMCVLWLAWPSLRRPAAWFPPAVAVGFVIGLAIVAAQPRLVFAVLPAAGVLLTLGAVVKAFRGS